MSHSEVVWHEGEVSAVDRAVVTGGKGATVLLTGLSGSGKSTIAMALEKRLIEDGRAAYVLDGDNLRHGLNADLSFSNEDRSENIRRVGEVARLINDSGLVAIAPIIAPFADGRRAMRRNHESAGLDFVEVFVDTSLAECEKRDPKGLYARARRGEIVGMTGIDSPYERPESPDILIQTEEATISGAVDSILALLEI